MRRWIAGLALALLASMGRAQTPVCTATSDSVSGGSETTCTITVHVACTPCPSPTPTPSPTPEPSVYDDAVALWKLDEESDGSGPVTRADSIGSLDLTDNNTVASAAKGAGAPANLPDNVANFVAGNNEYLNRTSITIGTSVSVSYWLKAPPVTGVYAHLGFGTENTYGANHVLDVYSQSGTVFADHAAAVLANGGALAEGNWYHIYAEYDETTKKVGISVNNASLVLSSVGAGTATIDRVFIGALTTFPLTGGISSVAVFDRVLTADERAELYNSGDGAPLP